MNALGSRLSRSLSRRTCSLLGATVALLAIGFGPTVASAGATAAPEKTDVTIIFDTSGSMSGELGEAKEKILEVMTHVKATLPNVAFGVANVEDIPGWYEGTFTEELSEAEYEADSEKAWRLDQPVTTEESKVVTAIENLTIGDGGDGPEAYGRALWETDTNPNVGWRPGARHEIVLVADNVPHEHELNEGISESDWVENPFDTFEEPGGKWGIPGTAWTPGTDLDIQSVASELGTDGKPLQSVEFYGAEDGYLPYWEYWAGLSGGQALNGSSGELSTDLTKIIETGATKPLAACPGGEERNAEAICIVIPKPTSHPTATQVICNLVIATASDTCTATVGDAASSGATIPTGTVTFVSTSGGTFSPVNTCTLTSTPMYGNTSSCAVQFLPPSTSSTPPAITATYSGDGTHNSSSASTHYPPISELLKDLDLSDDGTITPDGTVEVPVDCGFPCDVSGDLDTLPGLASLASFSEPSGQPAVLTATAAKHGKKKKKKAKPVQLGTGTLKLSAPGKGTLVIKLSAKGKRALRQVGPKGVHLTLKFTISTLHGTLVEVKSESVTLRPKKKSKGHGKGKK
jgi:hypothetical protein